MPHFKKDDDDLENLIQDLKSEDKDLRLKAAQKLGDIRDPSAIDPLIEAIDDEDEEVFKAVRDALEQLGITATELNDKGATSHELGRWNEAIGYFQKVLKINPRYALAWNNMGVNYEVSGEHKKAIECYQKAVEINPDDAVAWYNMEVNYERLGETSKAAESYLKAAEVNENYALAWYNAGCIFKRFGDYKQAEEYFFKTLELDPNYDQDIRNQGVSPEEIWGKKLLERFNSKDFYLEFLEKED